MEIMTGDEMTMMMMNLMMSLFISLDEHRVNEMCLCDSMCDDTRDALSDATWDDVTSDMCSDKHAYTFYWEDKQCDNELAWKENLHTSYIDTYMSL